MKTLGDKLCGIAGIIAQFGVAYCAWQAQWTFSRHWNEILEGAPLPQITVVSLAILRYVPVIAALLIGSGFALPILRPRIVWWTLLVALIEVLTLAFLIMGLGAPVMFITYKLSP